MRRQRLTRMEQVLLALKIRQLIEHYRDRRPRAIPARTTRGRAGPISRTALS